MVDHNSRIPYSEQASFSMDREIANGFTVGMGYLFTGAHKLVRALDLNISAPVGMLPDGKLQYNGAAYNNAGLLYYTDNSGNAVYHGATFQVNERWGRHLTFNANYTFSKTLDNGTFTTFVSTPQSLYQRNLERANSNQDVRHRFVGNFVAVGPEHGWLRNLQLGGVVTMQSPRPFTILRDSTSIATRILLLIASASRPGTPIGATECMQLICACLARSELAGRPPFSWLWMLLIY